MKKIGIVIVSILTFSCLQIIGLPTFEAHAGSSISDLTIVSPQNKTYNSKFLTLNATTNFVIATIESMSYSIDSLGSSRISNYSNSKDSTLFHGTLMGISTLPELAEGPHTITVYLEGTQYFLKARHYSEQAVVYFTIDTTPPSVSNLSIQNETYTQLSLPLNFNINESTSWIGCSVDNEANKTLIGNTTLTANLGRHSLVLYANDTAGNMGASPTIIFSIVEPFPTTLVAAFGVSLAVVAVCLLVYFKKRKH